MILLKDNLRLGLILGIIAPIFGMFLFYFLKFYPAGLSIAEFLHILSDQKPLITAFLSFSLFANAVIFTVYVNTRRDRTARGIFIVTCIYAVATLILKMILR